MKEQEEEHEEEQKCQEDQVKVTLNCSRRDLRPGNQVENKVHIPDDKDDRKEDQITDKEGRLSEEELYQQVGAAIPASPLGPGIPLLAALGEVGLATGPASPIGPGTPITAASEREESDVST